MAAGFYFSTGCDNGSTTTTDKDNTTTNISKTDTSVSFPFFRANQKYNFHLLFFKYFIH